MYCCRGQKVETYKLNKYFNLSVYGEYHGKKPVLIGVDVAGSLGRDSSALRIADMTRRVVDDTFKRLHHLTARCLVRIVVVNPDTLHPIAIFKSNMIELSKLRKLIMTIVTQSHPTADS